MVRCGMLSSEYCQDPGFSGTVYIRGTDHRIKLTLHKIDSIMSGELDELIDSLIAADQAAKLANLQEE